MLFHIVLITSAYFARASIVMTSVTYLDEYGDPVDMIYHKGQIQISCQLKNKTCKKGDFVHLIDSEDYRTVAKANCSIFSGNFPPFNVTVDGNLTKPGSEFFCHYKGYDSGNFTVPYYLCSSKQCPRKECLPKKSNTSYCMFTTESDEPIMKVPEDGDCLSTDSIFCPANRTNFCAAQRYNYTKVWSRYEGQSCEEKEGASVHLMYNGQKRLYGDTFVANLSDTILSVIVPRSSMVNISRVHCQLKDRRDTFRTNVSKRSKNPSYKFQMPSHLFSVSRVLKISCFVQGDVNVSLTAFMVIFNSTFKLTKKQSPLKSEWIDTMTFNSTVPVMPEITVAHEWVVTSSIVAGRNATLQVDIPGQYVVYATLSYYTCTPPRFFDKNYTDQLGVKRDQTVPSDINRTHPFLEPEPPSEPSLSVGAKVGITIAVIVITAAVSFLFFRMYKKYTLEGSQATSLSGPKFLQNSEVALFEKRIWTQHMQSDQQKELSKMKPYEPLRRLLDDTVKTLGYLDLKREAARLITLDCNPRNRNPDNRRQIFEYLISIGEENEKAQEQDEKIVKTVKGCRFEPIKCRLDNQVLLDRPTNKDCLNMSKLFDYYGQELLLSQAPTKSQFTDHWLAVWQEKVGVIVWVGGLMELNTRKIDEYIALKEAGKVICGPFHIRTNVAVNFVNEYDAYRITVTKSRESRELILLHVHMWPDHKVPNEPAHLADMVFQIQGHQLKQAAIGLPAMLAHCSLGVQRSPALLAVYIGRQMWLANKKVNLHGILRYIRRCRWKAFAMGNPFAQVQIIYGVMQVIATRSQIEGFSELHADSHEDAVFDKTARQADVADDQHSLVLKID